jgi:hypothetical protein
VVALQVAQRCWNRINRLQKILEEFYVHIRPKMCNTYTYIHMYLQNTWQCGTMSIASA